jgi:flagellar hook-associated protein 3 FlgL
VRIADRLRYETFKTNLNALKEKIDKNQTMTASGKRILEPSDDPVIAGRSVQIQSALKMNTQYKRNLDKLSMNGAFYENAVNKIGDMLTRIKELAVSCASDNNDQTARTTAADEVNGIIQQLVTIGNTKVAGAYIFAGKKALTPPFSAAGTFSGTQDVIKIAVDAKSTVDGGISGATVFKNGADLFATLQQFEADLRANNRDAIASDMNGIDACVDQNAKNLAYVGSYTKGIDNLLDSNQAKDLTMNTTESDMVGADFASLIADYSTLSTAYQAVLYSMGKMQDLTITNFLK